MYSLQILSQQSQRGSRNNALASMLLSARSFFPGTWLASKVMNMAVKETAEMSTPVRSVCILLQYPATVQSY
jgi:hypothetical protein